MGRGAVVGAVEAAKRIRGGLSCHWVLGVVHGGCVCDAGICVQSQSHAVQHDMVVVDVARPPCACTHAAAGTC